MHSGSGSDLFCEFSEEFELNEKLESNPELVNSDPYVDGWMVKIKFSNEAEFNDIYEYLLTR